MKSNTTLTRKELEYFIVEAARTRIEMALWACFVVTMTFRVNIGWIQCIATIAFAIMTAVFHREAIRVHKLSQEIRSELE